MENLKCSECGTQIVNGAKFCQKCGAPCGTPKEPQEDVQKLKKKRKKQSNALIIISSVLIIVLIASAALYFFVLRNNSSNKDKNDETTTAAQTVSGVKMSEDLNDFTFKLDGSVLSFPCEFEDLNVCGWEISDDKYTEDSVLSPGDSVFINITKADCTLVFCSYNPSDKKAPIKDCLIGSIEVFNYSNIDFSVAKGITFNSTRDEIIKAFGEPNETDGDNLIYYKTKKAYRTVFSLDNDKCCSIQMFNVRFKDNAEDEEIDSIKTIRFGTNAAFPPFEYVNKGSGVIGDYDGIDMAIANSICGSAGKDISIEDMAFESLLTALQNDEVDAVIAGISITEGRKTIADFSIPYYNATSVMIVKDADIKKAEDMNGKKIAVTNGSMSEYNICDMGYSYETYNNSSDTVNQLINGQCDVVVTDYTIAQEYVKNNPQLKIVEDNEAFETYEYAIAVKKGNTELLNIINRELNKMLADGTIIEIISQY